MRRRADFDERGAKLLGLSIDPVDGHQEWSGDIADVGRSTLNYPIRAEPTLVVAKPYGTPDPEADPKVTIRSVLIIGPKGKVRITLTDPRSVSRNVDEILRVLAAVKITDKGSATKSSPRLPTPTAQRDPDKGMTRPTRLLTCCTGVCVDLSRYAPCCRWGRNWRYVAYNVSGVDRLNARVCGQRGTLPSLAPTASETAPSPGLSHGCGFGDVTKRSTIGSTPPHVRRHATLGQDCSIGGSATLPAFWLEQIQ